MSQLPGIQGGSGGEDSFGTLSVVINTIDQNLVSKLL